MLLRPGDALRYDRARGEFRMKRKAGQTRHDLGADAATAEPARGESAARATVAVYADCGGIPAPCESEGAAKFEEPIQRRAAQLAAQLGLPLVHAADPAYDMLLTVTAEHLELRFPQRGGPGPLYVDFVGGPLGYARRVNRFGLLFQAVGFRGGRPTVLDATAGLGRDAFWLAYHGCRVTALERSPILFALLQDGLARAARVPEIHGHLGDRLRLLHADARGFLRQLNDVAQVRARLWEGEPPGEPWLGRSLALPRRSIAQGDLAPEDAPDVVYLDPMFPPKKKSALVKVEMRILRQLVGDDPDAGELFELACAVARQRVVVKRHRHAEPLAPHPTHSHSDKTTRYDVYVRPPVAVNR
jgi:16S rRNA (guanine1516-N2)-methyltransferase